MHTLKASQLYLLFILLSLSNTIGLKYASNQYASNDYVKLHAPTDVTVAYVGTSDVFLFWYAPTNYEVHCVGNISMLDVQRIHDELNGSFPDDGRYINRTLFDISKVDLSRVDGGADTYSIIKDSSNKTSVENSSSDSVTVENNGTITGNSSTMNVNKDDGNVTSTENTEVSPSSNSSSSEHKEMSPSGSPAHSSNNTGVSPTISPEHKEMSPSGAPPHSSPEPVKCSHKHSINSYIPSTDIKNVARKSQARILYYNVTYGPAQGGDVKSQRVSATETDCVLKNLMTNMVYKLNVSVVYASGDVMVSDEVEFKTVTTNCLCNKIGSQESSLNCDTTSLMQRHMRRICHCKTGHAGMFCQHCAFGWYRMGPDYPCYPCPCKPHHSNTGCHFEEGILFCDVCAIGYAGNLCQECDLGYYRDRRTRRCRRCQCNGNTPYCNSITGECFECQHNTAGFACDRCAHDYVGDAKLKTCVHKSELSSDEQSLPKGTIAAVCVLVILIICGIVGFIVYRKYKSYPMPRPFFTVELKDDHEGVNFSSVPDDDRLVFNEDSDFYEKQGGKRNRDGTQIYSPLQESM